MDFGLQDVYPRISNALEGLEIGILGMYVQSYSDIPQSLVAFLAWPSIWSFKLLSYYKLATGIIIISFFIVLFQLTMSVSCMTTHSIFLMFLIR